MVHLANNVQGRFVTQEAVDGKRQIRQFSKHQVSANSQQRWKYTEIIV